MRNKVLYLQLCLLFIISSLPVQKAQAGEKDTPTEYNTPIYPKSVIRISLCRTAKRNPLIFPI